MAKKAKSERPQLNKTNRKYLSQTDVPAFSLQQSIRVCTAIATQHDGEPVSPLQLAQDLNMSPNSGPFRMLCGASIAYGLTIGGYNAAEISLDVLGKRIVQPMAEGDDQLAMREAILRPRVSREFLEKYSGAAMPPDSIAINVLSSMGVPRDRAAAVANLILEGATSVGFVREIKGKKYVDLGTRPSRSPVLDNPASQSSDELSLDADDSSDLSRLSESSTSSAPNDGAGGNNAELLRRVFVTHGKNKAFLDPIRKLLGFGSLVPVVSIDRQSVSKPVPSKVMDDMRSCGAAIIHVDAEQRLLDAQANEHIVINQNVLIEIGAAIALYGQRFILLVRHGVELPSNLQGLYEVRYAGDTLDSDATIRLLEAINDIKNHPLPARQGALEAP